MYFNTFRFNTPYKRQIRPWKRLNRHYVARPKMHSVNLNVRLSFSPANATMKLSMNSTNWKFWCPKSPRCTSWWERLVKSNFCLKIPFWQNPNIFTSFSPKFFLTIFLVKSKLSTVKQPKTTKFSRVFHPKRIDNFSREIFGQKIKISNSVVLLALLESKQFFSLFLFS